MMNKAQDVVLLQIGTLFGRAYVFDMRKLESCQKQLLSDLFSDKSLSIFGSGCAYDVSLLNQTCGFQLSNFFDFIDLVSKVLPAKDYDVLLGSKSGLKWMCNKLIAFDFAKLHWTEYEKFSYENIPEKLISYAALDVLTLIDLYLNLHFYHNNLPLMTSDEILQNCSAICAFGSNRFTPKRHALSSIRENFKYTS